MTHFRFRWLLRIVFAVACALAFHAVIFVFWWYCLRSDFWLSGARISYETGGKPGTITFLVRNTDGQPLPGVFVRTQSYSGWTQERITDASGRAVVTPGEREVLGVSAANREVMFRHQGSLIEMLFSPGCSDGLTVTVVLRP